MEKGFGQLAVDIAGRFRDPDKPQESHTFQESQQLARCIDLLLPTAKAEPQLGGSTSPVTRGSRDRYRPSLEH